MKKIAKLVGFVEGFIFALVAFMATVGGLAAWYNVDWRAINKSVDENSDL